MKRRLGIAALVFAVAGIGATAARAGLPVSAVFCRTVDGGVGIEDRTLDGASVGECVAQVVHG